MWKWIQTKLIGSGTTDKKNFLWNMIGSGIFAVVSMLLSFFMIRVLGAETGGIFSIAITLSQMFAYIAYFEMRTYQVTDVQGKFTFSEYHGAKLVLCVFMMLICGCYVGIQGYTIEKTGIILLMCLYRLLDGYADLYEGTFQREGRLDLTGKSLFYRTLLSAGVMVTAVLLTQNLILSILLAVIAAVVGIGIFDILLLKNFQPVKMDFSKVSAVIKECFAMFLGSFLWTYILSASRIAIDANMTSDYQSYYQTIFMPVSVINLFVTFILKPSLLTLSAKYDKREYKLFFAEVSKILLCIVALTVVCMAGAYLLGIPVLSMVIGYDLQAYRGVLVLLMLAGGFNSISYFMYYLLSIMRRPKEILVGYISASLLSFFIASPMVQSNGIMGAAMSFLITVCYLSAVFVVLVLWNVKKDKDRK